MISSTLKLPDGKYTMITTEQDLKNLAILLSKCKEIAIDTETSGVNWLEDTLLGISISPKEKESYYIPIQQEHKQRTSMFDAGECYLSLSTVQHYLKDIFSSDIIKYLHNAKFDMHFLHENGMTLGKNVRDTMLLAWIFYNRDGMRYGLKGLTLQELGYKMTELQPMLSKYGAFENIPIQDAAMYAAADADFTLRLGHFFEKKLPTPLKKIYNLENMVNYVLLDMETEGISLDLSVVEELRLDCESKKESVLSQIKKITSIDINSPQQLSMLLFDEYKLPTGGMKEGKSGYYSTGKLVLQALKNEHPIIPLILEYRKWEKLLNTYYNKLPKMVNKRTKRIHTSYSSIRASEGGITSGRLSSDSPNLQQIPPVARRAFVAKPNHKLVCIDYSQQEVRILAIKSGDNELINAFKLENVDVHSLVTAKRFKVSYDTVIQGYTNQDHPDHYLWTKRRKDTKAVTFGLAYGQTKFGFASRLNVSPEDAQKFIDEYFEAFPGIKHYIDETKRFTEDNGYVQTLFGRRRYFDLPKKGDPRREKILREAVNMPIQGTGADIMKIAMINTWNWLKNNPQLKSKMVLQIHDELVLECPDEEVEYVAKEVKKIMETAVTLKVPMACDIEVGRDWYNIVGL